MLKKNKRNEVKIGIGISVFFDLLTLFCFGLYIRKIFAGEIELQATIPNIFLNLFVALSVHMIKALRLYIILFENHFLFQEYVNIYAKTALVNLLLPYKSGELYRGFCIGRLVSSYVQGYMIVLFDRFIDTLALMTIIAASALFAGSVVTPFYIALMLFLALLILAYCVFLPLYKFWNHFLIFNRSSENALKALHFLHLCNKAYSHINRIIRGRFLILYLVSLAAWVIEIGGLLIVGKTFSASKMSNYLADVMTGNLNSNNIIYLLTCFLLFTVLIIITAHRNRNGRNQHESTGNI